MSEPPIASKSSAVLVWIAAGATPTEAAFDVRNVQPPPHPNPEAWWWLTEAIEHAIEMVAQGKNSGKEPWIKAGDAILNSNQIHELYKTIQARKPQV